MKVAYFSPLPPKRSGIATYSSYLIPALSKHLVLDLFDHGYSQAPAPGFTIYDYLADPTYALHLERYDACLYHIGNHPEHHGNIYRVLLRKPGVVVLHDAIIYFLIAGGGPGALLKEICLNRRRWALPECLDVLAHSPNGDILRYSQPERFPLLMRLLRQAQAVIVHSDTTKRFLLNAGYEGPIHIVHMVAPGPGVVELTRTETGSDSVREELGIPNDMLLIGTFGFIGRTKRLDTVLEALDRIHKDIPFRLLIVGIGEQPDAVPRGSRIRDRVVQCGYVNDRDFIRYLRAVDIVINLRHPSMGEASLTLIQAMAQGRACVVTNDAWFSELPDECVWKTRGDESEVEDVSRAIVQLATDEGLRHAFGQAALSYVRSHCVPEQVAAEYKAVLDNLNTSHDRNVESHSQADADGLPQGDQVAEPGEPPDPWVKIYFARRIARALP